MTNHTVWALAIAALAGCSGGKDEDSGTDGVELPQQRAAVLEGFHFGWGFYNHRLSHLTVRAGLDTTEVAVIGGTSTTSEDLDPLPKTCDPASCDEFPFFDTADVSVWWAVAESTRVALVPMTVTLEVGRDGAEGVATGTLPAEIPGAVGAALLSGVSLDTDHPLAGDPDCYDPRYGWHPNRIAVALGGVEVSGTSVSVPVSATFSAGKTFDPDRVCIDEVNERAVVSLTVDLVAVWGDTTIVSAPVETGADYPFSGDRLNPEPQEEVAPVAVDLSGPADPLLGFRSVDFRFDPERTDDRGAYLRTLGWWVTPDGEAAGVATNYSPGTQLEDFGYTFAGEVVAVDVQGAVTRGLSSDELDAEIDADKDAVIHVLPH